MDCYYLVGCNFVSLFVISLLFKFMETYYLLFLGKFLNNLLCESVNNKDNVVPNNEKRLVDSNGISIEVNKPMDIILCCSLRGLCLLTIVFLFWDERFLSKFVQRRMLVNWSIWELESYLISKTREYLSQVQSLFYVNWISEILDNFKDRILS